VSHAIEQFGRGDSASSGVELAAASGAGEIRSDLSADELLYAVARLCKPIGDADGNQSRRLVSLLVNGLRSSSS